MNPSERKKIDAKLKISDGFNREISKLIKILSILLYHRIRL